MIESLQDREAFRRRVRECWKRNSSYWLSSPLRQVNDVGNYIVDEVIRICSQTSRPRPSVIDLGFGNAWLYEALRRRAFVCDYVGLDYNEDFVAHARSRFGSDQLCRFELFDLEEPVCLDIKADVVVYAFTLFELTDLQQPMVNAYQLLTSGGSLLVSSIDNTYLILAVSNSLEEFYQNLTRYELLPGVKYTFQPIDLGDRSSSTLEYPSVLHSLEKYLSSARNAGFHFTAYKEHIFTSKPIPKVYIHLELTRAPG